MPLGYDYQYWLASMLLDRLDTADGDLADFLHSHTGYKFYTFSNLRLEDRRDSNDGLQFDNAHFFLTSPDKEFIEGFASGLLQEPEFELGHSEFMVKSVEILDGKDVPEKCTMKTLSPIYVKTRRKVDGELKDWDLYPTDGKFYERLHQNLVDRYEDYYGEKPSKDFFDITNIHHHKERRYTVKGDYRRCNEMKFDIQASKELMKLGYEAGFGEKNAMGFGCVEVVNGA
ncbi:MAG: CRISPR-associated endoribonuclease Cas6 [Thermoplasmata archaeon]